VTTVDDERERTAHHHATPRRTTILAFAIVGCNDRLFALVGIFLLNLGVYDVENYGANGAENTPLDDENLRSARVSIEPRRKGHVRRRLVR
jgi:hypothetical protein